MTKTIDVSVQQPNNRPEFRLTRNPEGAPVGVNGFNLENDSGMLKFEIVWSTPGWMRNDKTCTYREACELRDALIELYPIEETQPVTKESVEYKVYPAGDGQWDVFEEQISYLDGHGTGKILARFWDENDAYDYIDNLLDKETEFKKLILDAWQPEDKDEYLTVFDRLVEDEDKVFGEEEEDG